MTNRILWVCACPVVCLAVFMMNSCSKDSVRDSEMSYADEDNNIERIQVLISTRGDDILTYEEEAEEEDDVIDPYTYDLGELIPYQLSFDSQSVIFVSQMTNETPAFQNDGVIYSYGYIPDSDEAKWDNDYYNFTPFGNANPLEWFKIGNAGTYHGGFSLYALYFPKEMTLRQKAGENGSINYSVMQDQSTLDNLIKSDILGAYHSTPTLFSRLRFRMHHLMTYLRVRLYMPVYDEELHTGFREQALHHATLDHVTPDFAVEWSANRSSDTQGPAIVALSGDGSIKMYQHPVDSKIWKLKYRQFLKDNYYDQGIEGDFDYVRIYDFSVLLPLQKGTTDAEGHENNFLGTDFLSFYIKSNSGIITRYYFSQAFGGHPENETESSSTVETGEEVLQYLQLLVPRVGNKMIYVKSTVNPWNERKTSMVLKPDEE